MVLNRFFTALQKSREFGSSRRVYELFSFEPEENLQDLFAPEHGIESWGFIRHSFGHSDP